MTVNETFIIKFSIFFSEVKCNIIVLTVRYFMGIVCSVDTTHHDNIINNATWTRRDTTKDNKSHCSFTFCYKKANQFLCIA